MPDELETQDVATPDEQAVEPVLDALADEAVSTGADEAEATAPLVPAPTKREAGLARNAELANKPCVVSSDFSHAGLSGLRSASESSRWGGRMPW